MDDRSRLRYRPVLQAWGLLLIPEELRESEEALYLLYALYKIIPRLSIDLDAVTTGGQI